ncbi:MAG: hypothetical protein WKG32_00255, partial [Gemmatimonadaceae bacterium]
ARALAFGALLVAVAADAVLPQDARCTDPSLGVVRMNAFGEIRGGDACQKGVDLFNYLTPQLGNAIAGGNATLGQAGTLGGLGRFSLGLRVNAVRAGIPDVEADEAEPSIGAVDRDFYPVKDRPLPMPQVEGAIGLFGGLPIGLASVGGVDALFSGFYLPSASADRVDFNGGGFKVGYGIRVGLLGETPVLPGISFTWARRDLPTVDIAANPVGSDEVTLNEFTNETTAWRFVIGKGFGPVAVAAGYGKDAYKSSATVFYSVNENCGIGEPCPVEPVEPFRYSRDSKATSMFADLSLSLKLFRLVAEVGQMRVNDISAADFYNEFAQDPSKVRMFGSVAFRFGRD